MALPMNSKRLWITFATLIVLCGAANFGLSRLNAGLRERIDQLTGPSRQAAELGVENQKLRELSIRMRQNTETGAKAMEEELMRLRAEVTALEKQIRISSSVPSPQADRDTDANLDPEKAPVKIEHLRNLGRETPSAAFQTLIWSAFTGTNASLTESVALSEAASEKLAVLIAGLPEEVRAKYRGPENLVGLFLTADILKSPSVQVLGATDETSDRVVLRTLIGTNPRESRIAMVHRADGWRMAVADFQVDRIIAALRGESGPK